MTSLQYGWFYEAGNALVLTSIPNQFVGTQGAISNASPYSGNTANVFTFGITNSSGNTVVVNYSYNPSTGLGRSKLGNMQKTGSFRVPPEYSGTKQDNFITRALIGSRQEADILKIFKKELA